jgi:hypothetical protein
VTLDQQIEARRADADFTARLARIMREDAAILARLAGG